MNTAIFEARQSRQTVSFYGIVNNPLNNKSLQIKTTTKIKKFSVNFFYLRYNGDYKPKNFAKWTCPRLLGITYCSVVVITVQNQILKQITLVSYGIVKKLELALPNYNCSTHR
ncbi:MAG: hypothetical protein ACK4WN_10280 [Aphanizomenon sp.]|jgi:hypothetical protein|nr:MAG: hypothetical protein AN483_05540 [Aphanizomenon flos-aquae MDT14a]